MKQADLLKHLWSIIESDDQDLHAFNVGDLFPCHPKSLVAGALPLDYVPLDDYEVSGVIYDGVHLYYIDAVQIIIHDELVFKRYDNENWSVLPKTEHYLDIFNAMKAA